MLIINIRARANAISRFTKLRSLSLTFSLSYLDGELIASGLTMFPLNDATRHGR